MSAALRLGTLHIHDMHCAPCLRHGRGRVRGVSLGWKKEVGRDGRGEREKGEGEGASSGKKMVWKVERTPQQNFYKKNTLYKKLVLQCWCCPPQLIAPKFPSFPWALFFVLL